VGVELEARGIRRRLGLHHNPDTLQNTTLILRTVGPGAATLARLEPELQAFRADAVLVTGLAGGCAPTIASGEVVVGSAVGPTSGGEWMTPDPRLLTRAMRALEGASLPYRTGRLLTVRDVVETPSAKADCWRTHAAVAVDMEGAHVLAWAARVGLPALAVRVVADGPADTLPSALARAVGPRGEVRVSTVLGWMGRPALLPAAWRIWRRSSVALDRLARFLAAFTRTPVEP